MEHKVNKTYKKYVDEVFGYLKRLNAHEGEGLFLRRTLLAKHNTLGGELYNYLILTIENLVKTGYLSEKDGFYKLTEQGYGYIQGEPLNCGQIDLSSFINAKQEKKYIYQQLWQIIGVENKALFYVPGPSFLKIISPYLTNIISNYTEFIKDLKEQGKSQSRYSWYKELFLALPEKDLQYFLSDLSNEIRELYENESQEQISQEAILDDIPFVQSNENPKCSNMNNPKKKVFITYCWETQIDQNHAKWVHNLANDLSSDFEIIIDVEQPLGIELNQFMEQQISHCDKVLIIATPEYKRRADNREYGVGYETSLITADLVSDQNRIKFIPIIRKGDVKTAYPLYLGNRKGLQMTEKDNYEEALKELISNLKKY